MAKSYSRFAHSEEKRNIRRAVGFLFLTFITLILLFFFGLPLVVKFAAFFSDLRKSSTPIEKTDTTPPAPPQLENLPEATNKSSLEVAGRSESGATVSVFMNSKKAEVVADEEGRFTTKLSLGDGENIIYAFSVDKAGNTGQKSSEVKVTFDNEDPKLEVTSPQDGAEFSGSKNKKVTIQGTTDAEANLTINDRFVTVSDDGKFSFSITLSEGDNSFNIKVVDAAGNTTEKALTLKYTP